MPEADPEIKPGDIVRFKPRAQTASWWPEWVELNGNGPFLAHGRCSEGYNIRLTHPDGRPFVWGTTFGGSKFGTEYIGESWLARDEFLTAVHKAKNEI